MWADARGVWRRDAILAFSQIHPKSLWEQRRGETDSHLWTFSPRFFDLSFRCIWNWWQARIYREARPDCRRGEWKSSANRLSNLDLATEPLAIAFIKLQKKPDFHSNNNTVALAQQNIFVRFWVNMHAALLQRRVLYRKGWTEWARVPNKWSKSQCALILEQRGSRQFYWRQLTDFILIRSASKSVLSVF